MPPSILTGSIIIGEGFRLLKYRTAVIIIAVLIAIGLWLLLNKTRIGAMTRAGMDDAEMTIGLGINNALVSGGVFLLGAFLAGFAGYIGAPIWGARYMAGFEITLFCCAVVIVGGMGSVPGTLLGALLIGIIDSLGRAYFPEFARFTMYAAIILMLMIRPSGLLGRKI
jgi:branched-chain amino acid transport system permease protein